MTDRHSPLGRSATDRDSGDLGQTPSSDSDDRPLLHRRRFLQGVGLATVSGFSLGTMAVPAQDSPTVFHDTFSEGFEGWRVGRRTEMDPAAGPEFASWQPEYDGSIELHVYDPPSSIEAWRTVPSLTEGTEITVDYASRGAEAGRLSLFVKPSDDTWDELASESVSTAGEDGQLRTVLTRSYSPTVLVLRLELPRGEDPTSLLFVTEAKAIQPGDHGNSRPRSLMIAANDGGVEYTLVVDGSVTLHDPQGDFSCDGNETLETHDDGSVTASGLTGPAPDIADRRAFLGDRYIISGAVDALSLEPRSPSTQVNLYLDERRATPEEIRSVTGGTNSHTFMITANESGVDYSITVDGTIEPQSSAGDFSSDDGDSVTDGADGTVRVTDQTGPAPRIADDQTFLGDRFLVDGEILDLSLTPGTPNTDVNLYLDECLTSRENLLRGTHCEHEQRGAVGEPVQVDLVCVFSAPFIFNPNEFPVTVVVDRPDGTKTHSVDGGDGIHNVDPAADDPEEIAPAGRYVFSATNDDGTTVLVNGQKRYSVDHQPCPERLDRS